MTHNRSLGALILALVLVAPLWASAELPPSSSSGTQGGGLMYCTGPLSPGWNVSLPGGGCSGGAVLGASTEAPNTSCTISITAHMHIDWKNDAEQVKLLQAFLAKELGIPVPVTGAFDQITLSAVKAFQLKYPTEILAPWGITEPTGFVYKTTLTQIQKLQCQ